MTTLSIIPSPSPNCEVRPQGATVKFLIIHYTGMTSGTAALARMCDPASKVSAHYMIEQDGTVFQLVDEAMRAWHAGVSRWEDITDINSHSIGIELVNPGHEFGYQDFPPAQIDSLIALSQGILARHQIAPHHVLGHSDIAPLRKTDPGEKFPWEKLAAQGIGFWPPAEKPQASQLTPAEALHSFGYALPQTTVEIEATTLAFQRHFLPNHLNGQMDEPTWAVLLSCIKNK